MRIIELVWGTGDWPENTEVEMVNLIQTAIVRFLNESKRVLPSEIRLVDEKAIERMMSEPG